MKPTRNQYYCPGCQHQKMLFTSKKEAVLFLKYNAVAIEQKTGKRPVRAYYCNYCCGWHLTSKPNSYSRKDLMKQFGTEVGGEIYCKITPLITKGKTISGGMTLKLKELRHNLKYENINCSKCRCLIDELFDFFEIIIGAQLEDKTTIDKLFSKFTGLCSIFKHKRQMAIIA